MAQKGNKARSLIQHRRDTILQLLKEEMRVNVKNLSYTFDVSPLTIRRDLEYLETLGLIVRQYGYAQYVGNPDESNNSTETILKISQHAGRFVHDDSVIFINTSSTALNLIEFITAQNVTVVTNSALCAQFSAQTEVSVLCTGGELKNPRGILSGEFALKNITCLHAQQAFVGCAGISLLTGITSTTQNEASINRAMLDRSSEFVLVADSSKFNVSAGFSYASLDEVDLLITDRAINAENIESLKHAGVKRIITV